MPGHDGTGPKERGPATGWGRGPCGRTFDTRDPDAYPIAGVGRDGIPRGGGGGRGRCCGGGGGRGQGRRSRHGTGFPGPSQRRVDDPDALRSHASLLEEQLQAIRERLVALEGEAVEEKVEENVEERK